MGFHVSLALGCVPWDAGGSHQYNKMASDSAHIRATLLHIVSDALRANSTAEERKEVLSTVLEGLEQGLIVARAPECTCGSLSAALAELRSTHPG